MKRNDFIKNLEFTGKYILYYKNKEIEIYEDCILGIDGKRKRYNSFKELFDIDIFDKKIGDIVDELKKYDKSCHYHIPILVFDESGNEVIL